MGWVWLGVLPKGEGQLLWADTKLYCCSQQSAWLPIDIEEDDRGLLGKHTMKPPDCWAMKMVLKPEQ